MDLYLGASPFDPAAPAADEHHLCFSWDRYASMDIPGLRERRSAWEDHLPFLEAGAILKTTEDMADAWYLRGGRDFTEFDELSLGRCWSWIFWCTKVLPAYRFARAMKAAVAEFRPGVVRYESCLPPLFRALLPAAIGPGPRLEERPIAWSGTTNTRWVLPQLEVSPLKLAAAAGFNALSSLSPGRRRPDLLYCHYHSLDPVVARLTAPSYPLRLLLAQGPPKGALGALALSGAEILTEHRSRPRFTPADAARLEAIRASWRATRGDAACRAALSADGVELFDGLAPALDDIFDQGMESLAWAARAYSERWSKRPPAAVLLPYDEPPHQALIGQIARRAGTPVFLYLHGLPYRHRFPMRRTTSTHFVVGGPEEERLYSREGLHGSRALVVGNPKFDAYPPAPPAPASLRRVLLLTHPWPSGLWMDSDLDTERHAREFARIFSELPELEITLKLHPSESLEHYRALLRDWPSVRIERDRPIIDCLSETDLLVGSFSTAILEAMLLARPVLVLNWTRTVYEAPFDGKWGVTPLKSPEELVARLAALRADPSRLAELTKPYAAILDAFAGPRDGKASERVADAVAAAARPR